MRLLILIMVTNPSFSAKYKVASSPYRSAHIIYTNIQSKGFFFFDFFVLREAEIKYLMEFEAEKLIRLHFPCGFGHP